MGQKQITCFLLFTVLWTGLSLKIESAGNDNVTIINTSGTEWTVSMDENNHAWDGKPTPLFKYTDIKGKVVEPSFPEKRFRYSLKDDIFYATQSFDYETDPSDYLIMSTDEGDGVATIRLIIVNIDDEPPTLGYPRCSFDEHTLYDKGKSTCGIDVQDPDGWLGYMSFKIIPTTTNGKHNEEDLIFNLEFKEFPKNDTKKDKVYMTVNRKLDYKTSSFFLFGVEAQDSAHNPTTPDARITATVTVIDLRDSKPEWTKTLAVQQFKEKTPQEYFVEARDGDVGIHSTVYYKKVKEDDEEANYISIDKDTGKITVKPIDRDKNDKDIYEFEISAYVVDEKVPGDWSSNLKCVFSIIDVDDNPPAVVSVQSKTFNKTDKEKKFSIRFEENFDKSFNSSIVIVDRDTGPNAQYSVELAQLPDTIMDYSVAFMIIPNAGYKKGTFDIAVQDKSFLDYENETWRQFSFQVVSKGEGEDRTQHDQMTVEVSLIDVNDEWPKFAQSEYSCSINETAKKNDLVINVLATDADFGDHVRHSLVGSQIVISTLRIEDDGNIYVNSDNAFDYDKVNPILFQVRAVDNASHTASVPVTINLLDVNNKRPTISPGKRIEVEENQIVGTVLNSSITASDPDTTADLKAWIDWDNSYAMKNSRKVETTDTIIAKAVRFLDLVQEAGDSNRNIKIQLRVNSNNKDETSPDYETFDSLFLSVIVEDLNTDSEFKDTEGSVSETILVSIIDINDNWPYFPESEHKNRTVQEKTAIGTSVGSISAIDLDVGDIITYNCTADDPKYDWVMVDEKTGAFSVKDSGIDADIPLYHFDYTCNAVDNASHVSDPLKVLFSIVDTNDKTPVITLDKEIHLEEKVVADWKVAEIGTYDGDRDNPYKTVVCDFTNGNVCDKKFKVDNKNIIRVKNGKEDIDRDSMDDPRFVCELTCQDNPTGRPSERNTAPPKTFTIILDDVNDHTPVLRTEDMEAYENVKATQHVHELIAEDPDKDENGTITFSISSVTGGDGKDYRELFEIRTEEDYILDRTHKKAYLVASKDLKGFFGTYKISIKLSDQCKTEPRSDVYDRTLKIKKYNFISPRFVYPKEDQHFVLLSVQKPNSPLILYPNNTALQDFIVSDDEHQDRCVRWDMELTPKQISPAGDTFFKFESSKEGKCAFQLQVKSNYDPDMASNVKQYQLELIATAAKEDEPRPSNEASYTSQRNIKISFFSNAQEPTFEGCDDYYKHDVFEVEFLEEDASQSKSLPCEAHYDAVDDRKVFYHLVSDVPKVRALFEVGDHGTISLKDKLDYETDEKFEFQIVASNDTNPHSTKPLAYLKVVVSVIDINDNSPQFVKDEFFGALMTGYAIETPIPELTLEATDADKIDEGKLTYYIVGEVEGDGNGIKDIKNPFKVNEVSGRVILNFQVDAAMSGYFFFTAMVKDVQDKYGNGPHNGTASVRIFIVTSKNTVNFQFQNTEDEVRKNRDKMLEIVADVLGIGTYLQTIEKGSNENITAANLYFIRHSANGSLVTYNLRDTSISAVDADYILRQVRNIDTFTRLQQDLLLKATLRLRPFSSSANTSDNNEELLRGWLIAVSVVLGALCTALLVIFIVKTRRLSNKIKKLTSKKFGSQESDLNKDFAAPNTNRNAIEGSNPVFREDNYKNGDVLDFTNPNFDQASMRSGDSDMIGVEDNPEFDISFNRKEDPTSQT